MQHTINSEKVQRLANYARSEDCLVSTTESGIWIRVGRGLQTAERHVTTIADMKRLLAAA